MTDRFYGFTVTLERGTREDDAEAIVNAIKMVRGVLDVVPLVADANTYAAEARAKHDLTMKLLDVVKP